MFTHLLRNTSLFTLAFLCLAACSAGNDDQASVSTTATTTSEPEPAALDALQRAVDTAGASDDSVPGVLLHLDAPARGLDVSVAAGVAERASQSPLSPDATFRIASNTKTFTAAATLRLVEDGLVGLDDPI